MSLPRFPLSLTADHPPPPGYTPPPLVAVYGDSFTTGYRWGGVGERGWPAVVGRTLTATIANNAAGGAGYVNRATFPWQVAVRAHYAQAALVVVFGGFNDRFADPEPVRLAAAVTFAAVAAHSPRARLVVVGPQWPNGDPHAVMWALRDAIAQSAAEAGAVFVDPLAERWFADRPDLIGPDALHPTDEGHAYMAGLLLPVLAAALAGQPAS